MTKTCSFCKENLELSAFTKNRSRKDGLESSCRECRKGLRLSFRYGIDATRYQHMLVEQGSKCAICGLPHEPNAPLVVDHHHGSGEVRGLLCSPCNAGIGLLRDSPEVLIKAAAYVSA